jgi:hypothetical protein
MDRGVRIVVVVGAALSRTWMLRPSAFILRRERVEVNRVSCPLELTTLFKALVAR